MIPQERLQATNRGFVRVYAEPQSRSRTNDFLDHINDALFKPAGLYAMIVRCTPIDPHPASPGLTPAIPIAIRAGKVDMSIDHDVPRDTSDREDKKSEHDSIGPALENGKLRSRGPSRRGSSPGSDGEGPIDSIEGMMEKDDLYLMIANVSSEEEN